MTRDWTHQLYCGDRLASLCVTIAVQGKVTAMTLHAKEIHEISCSTCTVIEMCFCFCKTLKCLRSACDALLLSNFLRFIFFVIKLIKATKQKPYVTMRRD